MLFRSITLGEKKITFQIWDTAGQERYNCMQSIFYQGADACIIVFDINDKTSFENVKSWKNQFEEYLKEVKITNFPYVMVGNKSDLRNSDSLSLTMIEDKSKELNMEYFEVSAKLGSNIDEAFKYIVKSWKIEDKNT